jgi:hypothetical protein
MVGEFGVVGWVGNWIDRTGCLDSKIVRQSWVVVEIDGDFCWMCWVVVCEGKNSEGDASRRNAISGDVFS